MTKATETEFLSKEKGKVKANHLTRGTLNHHTSWETVYMCARDPNHRDDLLEPLENARFVNIAGLVNALYINSI